MTMNSYLMGALVAAVFVSPVQAASLTEAMAGAQRSEANKARDQYRHPAETLAFLGVKPGDTVVEISPGGGWYTEILGPWLNDNGQYIAAAGNPAASEASAKSVNGFKATLAGYAPKAKVSVFSKGVYDQVAPEGSADAVLTFRNVHNWHMGGYGQDAFKAFFRALKKGGTLGVVDHRLPEDRPDADMSKSGYMKVSTVRALAEAAGFRYVGSSEVNANPKDTKDYPGGVWTLPPTFAEKDKDRAKFAAIGESDRMTLKFVKP